MKKFIFILLIIIMITPFAGRAQNFDNAGRNLIKIWAMKDNQKLDTVIVYAFLKKYNLKEVFFVYEGEEEIPVFAARYDSLKFFYFKKVKVPYRELSASASESTSTQSQSSGEMEMFALSECLKKEDGFLVEHGYRYFFTLNGVFRDKIIMMND